MKNLIKFSKWLAWNSILWVSLYFSIRGNNGWQNILYAYVLLASFFSLFLGNKDLLIKLKKSGYYKGGYRAFIMHVNFLADWAVLGILLYFDYIFLGVAWTIHNLMQIHLFAQLKEKDNV